MQHLRTSGEHLARGRVASCLPWHDAHAESGVAGAFFTGIAAASFVKRLWAPCGTDVRRDYCQDFNLDTWLDRMPLPQVAGMLWTRLMLTDPSHGHHVPKPTRHDHVVWELHLENGELDTRGFGDGSLSHGRMKRLTLAVLNKDRKVTAKLHDQDITLAERVAFLWYLRHVSAMCGTFFTDSLDVAAGRKARSTAPEGSSSARRPGDESGSASTRSEQISFRWNGLRATRQCSMCALARSLCGSCRRMSLRTSRRRKALLFMRKSSKITVQGPLSWDCWRSPWVGFTPT